MNVYLTCQIGLPIHTCKQRYQAQSGPEAPHSITSIRLRITVPNQAQEHHARSAQSGLEALHSTTPTSTPNLTTHAPVKKKKKVCITHAPPQGYRVGSSQLQFEIKVHISVEDPASNSTDSTEAGGAAGEAPHLPDEELTLSPSVPLAVSSSKLASMRLLGDLATYEQTTVLRCVWMPKPLLH